MFRFALRATLHKRPSTQALDVKKPMPLPDPPPKWGTDEVTQYLDTARTNAFATFANLSAEYAKLSKIDSALRILCTNLDRSENWFAGFFALRAHSSWLAAVSLAMSAQVLETFVVLRTCLESALYGLHIARNPSLREVWLRRSDSSQHKAQVLKEFQIRVLIDTLSKEDAHEAQVAKTLYDQCIDDGAHPNERGFMGNLKMEKGSDQIRFKVKYMNPEPLALALALKTTARVGVCALGIFRCVYKERFDILGISVQLPTLRQGL